MARTESNKIHTCLTIFGITKVGIIASYRFMERFVPEMSIRNYSCGDDDWHKTSAPNQFWRTYHFNCLSSDLMRQSEFIIQLGYHNPDTAAEFVFDGWSPKSVLSGLGIVLLKNAETEQGSNFLGSNRRFRHAGCSNRRSNHFSNFPANAENHDFERLTLEYTQKTDDSMTVLNLNLSFTFSNRIL